MASCLEGIAVRKRLGRFVETGGPDGLLRLFVEEAECKILLDTLGFCVCESGISGNVHEDWQLW